MALVIAGCREAGESQAPRDPSAREILGILTQAETATGAERLGKIAWYSPETLYEYVNGMAPYYVDAGFQRLAHSEWKSPDAEAAGYVELDLFDMGSPEGALDIFSDLRTEGTKYLEIGSETSASDSAVEIRAGRYYAKLTVRRGAEKQKRFLETLAEAVAEAAGPGPSDAELVAPLPAEGMIPHTAAYTTKAFLGHDFLNGIREAAYDVDGHRVRLFIMDAGGAEEASAVWQKWRDSVSPPPEGCFQSAWRKTSPWKWRYSTYLFSSGAPMSRSSCSVLGA